MEALQVIGVIFVVIFLLIVAIRATLMILLMQALVTMNLRSYLALNNVLSITRILLVDFTKH